MMLRPQGGQRTLMIIPVNLAQTKTHQLHLAKE